MNHLPYLGLFIKDESPRGYLLRTALNNGYTTIGQLAVRLGADTNPAYLNTLLGKSDIVDRLIKCHEKNSEDIKNVFFKQIKGVTKTTDVIVNGNRLPFKMLRTSGHHICWDCLKENNLISVTFDLDVIDVCTKHKSYLQHACTTCRKPFNWRNTAHKTCNCHATENNESPTIDCSGAERVALAFKNSEYKYLTKLLDLLKALRQHKSSHKVDRNNTLNLATQLLDGSWEVFYSYLRQEQKKYSGIPIRVLASPLIALGYNDINEKVNKSLVQFMGNYPSECGDCQCESKYLTTDETTVCLEITKITLNKLGENGLLNSSELSDNSKFKVFNYKILCQFFRHFIPRHTKNKETGNLEPISYTAPGNSLIEKLKDVQSEKVSTIKVNQTKGLSGVYLAEQPSISKIKKESINLLTSTEVARYLNVYSDAIRSISKTKLLVPSLVVSTQPFFRAQDVELFDKKYVFSASLARKYQIDARRIAHRLRVNNVKQVSGPGVDSTITPLFLRRDVERLDLFSIRYADYNERNASKTKRIKSQTPEHLTAKSIAKLLDVPLISIAKIENYGLLNRLAVTDRSEKRRVYSQESLDRTVEWFSTAKNIDEFAKKKNISKWLFIRLFITTKYVRPLTLSLNNQLLSTQDQYKISEHIATFCTCSEADKYHSAPDKHFHNLVKTNRFPTVSKSDYLCNTSMILLYWRDVKKHKI